MPPRRFAIDGGNMLNRRLVRCTGNPNGSRGTTSRWCSHAQRHRRGAVVAEIGRDLRPAVACADDQNSLADVGRGVRVGDRVREPTRIGLPSRPRRNQRLSILSRRDHHAAALPEAAISCPMVHSPLTLCPIARYGGAGDDAQAKVARVLLEICHQIVSRKIPGIALGDREVREPGKLADGVEMKPIVSPGPGAADSCVLFQHCRVDSAPRKGGRRGKSRGTPADDHDG